MLQLNKTIYYLFSNFKFELFEKRKAFQLRSEDKTVIFCIQVEEFYAVTVGYHAQLLLSQIVNQHNKNTVNFPEQGFKRVIQIMLEHRINKKISSLIF